MLLNFSDRTGTGAFNMIWPLAKEGENIEGYGADFVQRQEYHTKNAYFERICF